MTTFNAFWVEKNESELTHSVIERSVDDLPEGEMLIKVEYSSVNYKDALSAKGMPGVTRSYPHTPGIDAAGVVASCTNSDFAEGDQVICIGFDLGMNTAGGYGEYIRVPTNWVTKIPEGFSSRESMVIGTAGFTAALCVEKIERMGAKPADGPVLVTGATGGVGSIAVMLLAKLGYEVVASSGKPDKVDFLKSLGAASVIGRDELSEENKRPMAAPVWAHAVDCVGGEILSNVIKCLYPLGSVAICGLVASPNFSTTVLPFILRGVNVLGVDSVEIPIDYKNRIWDRLATDWRLSDLDSVTNEIGLSGLSEAIDQIFAGQVSGRTLVSHSI
ncbi:MAG: YhdH/YhfP family quinone oxidoreductase [Pseudomonadales bacterium]|jgi:alcohol dehydrogenase|nr:oxidoreductase [Gammaproteobacteria bacterium]MDP6026345.1 YhdH/YhfP family quinone oxidoreductase [Pseudomonadales bacterium]MDP6315894.1 YhdH/YhfP family quinone oxidoreductase [Pseudomonadales bacterium]MDP7314246.1 YhdH/YhfP family quinone oxidoreductase [Pseudomonadales bacterium]|tara:strand:- start:5018 stop:6010 length:993 start_codon:yes stop_codon:yes gene_type:complete